MPKQQTPKNEKPIFSVRFSETVLADGNELKSLGPDHKAILCDNGVRFTSKKGQRLFIPFTNIVYVLEAKDG